MINSEDSPMSWSQSPTVIQTPPQDSLGNSTHSSQELTSYENAFVRQDQPMPNVRSSQGHQITNDEASHNEIPQQTMTMLRSSSQNQTMASDIIMNIDSTSTPATWFGNFTSINWLPDDWTPDFNMESGTAADTFDAQHTLMFGDNIEPRMSGIQTAGENLTKSASRR